MRRVQTCRSHQQTGSHEPVKYCEHCEESPVSYTVDGPGKGLYCLLHAQRLQLGADGKIVSSPVKCQGCGAATEYFVKNGVKSENPMDWCHICHQSRVSTSEKPDPSGDSLGPVPRCLRKRLSEKPLAKGDDCDSWTDPDSHSSQVTPRLRVTDSDSDQ